MNWLQELETYKEDFIRDLRGLIAIASIEDKASARAGAPFGEGCLQSFGLYVRAGT